MIPATHAQTTIDVPAHLGWRLLAQLVDLTIVVFVFGLVISIYMASGIDVDREMEDGWLIEITFVALVFCYFVVFEALLSATPGKMAAGLRVTMRDGSRLTGPAVIVRNLVRLPELMFWYIPSIISVAASPERRRIGDFAARTMVWRRQRRAAGSGRHSRSGPRPAARARSAGLAGTGRLVRRLPRRQVPPVPQPPVAAAGPPVGAPRGAGPAAARRSLARSSIGCRSPRTPASPPRTTSRTPRTPTA